MSLCAEVGFKLASIFTALKAEYEATKVAAGQLCGLFGKESTVGIVFVAHWPKGGVRGHQGKGWWGC